MSLKSPQRISAAWRGGVQPYERLVDNSDYAGMVEYLIQCRDLDGDRRLSLRKILGSVANYTHDSIDTYWEQLRKKTFVSGPLRFIAEDSIDIQIVTANQVDTISGPAISMHFDGDWRDYPHLPAHLQDMQRQLAGSRQKIPDMMTGITHRSLALHTARCLGVDMYRVHSGLAWDFKESILLRADAAQLVRRRPPLSGGVDEAMYTVSITTDEFLGIDFSKMYAANQ